MRQPCISVTNKKGVVFFISQRPLVHKTLVSFSLPFIIKAKAQ